MLKHLSKSITILLLLNTLVACSNPTPQQANVKNDTPSLPNPELVKAESPIIEEKVVEKPIVDANSTTKEIPGGLNIPNGKECEKYFAKDAIQIANQKGVYINSRRSIFVGDDGIVLTNLMYKDKKLQLVTNLFYVGREVCIQEFSSLFLSFEDNEIHLINGLQKQNCAKVKSKEETGAIGMYHMPVNSTLFKRLLFAKPFSIALQTKPNDVSVFKAYDEDTAKDFRNAIRCAFEVLAVGFDLSNENILVDTMVNHKK